MVLLNQYYKKIIQPSLLVKYNIKNIYDIIFIQKIILSSSHRSFVRDQKNLIPYLLALEMITQQKAQITKAKQSIATFKLRKSFGIGCKVTLRNQFMYDFLYKTLFIALPKLRNLNRYSTKQLSLSGQFSFGLSNLKIYPEIEKEYYNFLEQMGTNVTLQFSNLKKQNINQIIGLLSFLQFPFVSNSALKYK